MIFFAVYLWLVGQQMRRVYIFNAANTQWPLRKYFLQKAATKWVDIIDCQETCCHSSFPYPFLAVFPGFVLFLKVQSKLGGQTFFSFSLTLISFSFFLGEIEIFLFPNGGKEPSKVEGFFIGFLC